MKSTGDTKAASLLASAFSASGVLKSHTAPPLEIAISRELAGDFTIDVGVIAGFLRNCDREGRGGLLPLPLHPKISRIGEARSGPIADIAHMRGSQTAKSPVDQTEAATKAL